MTTIETRKLDLLARFSQKEIFFHGGKLSHVKLDLFILIAFLLHLLAITLELVFPLVIKNSLTQPPIKVKYVDVQTSAPIKQKTSQKAKTKITEVPLDTNQKIFSKKQYPKQKIFHEKKIPNLKTRISPRVVQKSKPKVIKDGKENIQQKTLPSSSAFMGSKGSLSMLDQLNPEKYTSQNQKSEEKHALEDDEPIPLDTKEEKYVSYFSRIKHQIQRAWIYPSQGNKKLAGELTLKFEISKHGNLLSLRLISTSGSNLLDANAIKAVKNAAPYYPFPITIKKKKLSILATFVYSAN